MYLLHPGRYGQWQLLGNPRVSGPNTESGLFLFHRVVPEPVTGLGCGEVLLQRPVKLGFDNLLELNQRHVGHQVKFLLYRHSIFQGVHDLGIKLDQQGVEQFLGCHRLGRLRPIGQLLPQVIGQGHLFQPGQVVVQFVHHHLVAGRLVGILDLGFRQVLPRPLAQCQQPRPTGFGGDLGFGQGQCLFPGTDPLVDQLGVADEEGRHAQTG